jgi:hypothetical protein
MFVLKDRVKAIKVAKPLTPKLHREKQVFMAQRIEADGANKTRCLTVPSV